MWIVLDIIWALYLFIVAVYDSRKLYILGAHVIAAAAILAASIIVLGINYRNIIYGILLGGLVFLISYISKESVGKGDCWLILILAIYIGLVDTLQLLIVSFLSSAVSAGIYYIWRRAKVKQVKMKGLQLPFLPFIFLGFMKHLNRKYKGVYTVEIACIMPIIILLLSGIVLAGFYLHDKNVLYSKIYEFGSVARQEIRQPAGVDLEELEELVIENCRPKLLLFDNVSCQIEENSSEISIYGEMEFKGKRVSVSRVFALNDVERSIRTVRPVL